MSRKLLDFVIHPNIVIWLAVILALLWTLIAEANGEVVTLCHRGETMQVPPKAVKSHLKHGDYLGPCADPPWPTPTDTPDPPTPTEPPPTPADP